VEPLGALRRAIFAEFSKRQYGRVLELGPWDGRDTVHLAQHCRELVTVEGRAENIALTESAVASEGLKNVTIIHANLEILRFASLGAFDCVWCAGVLYHVISPWELIREIFGWTHLTPVVEDRLHGYDGCLHPENVTKPLAGLSTKSFWLTKESMPRAWRDGGFARFEFVTEPAPHPNGGLSAQFIARKEA
jgi:SAM-dependent methyltransferase